jgi:hypothetical protein
MMEAAKMVKGLLDGVEYEHNAFADFQEVIF